MADTDDAREQLTQDLVDGLATVNVDGMTVSLQDPAKRLDVIERLERDEVKDAAASQPHFGLRFTKLVPPGCG